MTEFFHRGRAAFARRALGLAGMAGALVAGTAHAQVTQVPLGSLVVPKNVTYWEMFVNATPIVKAVMILLLLASILSWTIWLAKHLEIGAARRRLKGDVRALAGTAEFGQARVSAGGTAAEMLDTARAEFARTGALRTGAAAEGLKERVAARLLNIEGNAVDKMMRGATVLATIGAIAPFVGLFGTVWGIMNSFIGISRANTTNLAVVAPGIAEALLATAMGLVAAIPAVVLYNHVTRSVAGYRRQLSDATTQVACLVSHDVDIQLGRESIARAA